MVVFFSRKWDQPLPSLLEPEVLLRGFEGGRYLVGALFQNNLRGGKIFGVVQGEKIPEVSSLLPKAPKWYEAAIPNDLLWWARPPEKSGYLASLVRKTISRVLNQVRAKIAHTIPQNISSKCERDSSQPRLKDAPPSLYQPSMRRPRAASGTTSATSRIWAPPPPSTEITAWQLTSSFLVFFSFLDRSAPTIFGLVVSLPRFEAARPRGRRFKVIKEPRRGRALACIASYQLPPATQEKSEANAKLQTNCGQWSHSLKNPRLIFLGKCS